MKRGCELGECHEAGYRISATCSEMRVTLGWEWAIMGEAWVQTLSLIFAKIQFEWNPDTTIPSQLWAFPFLLKVVFLLMLSLLPLPRENNVQMYTTSVILVATPLFMNQVWVTHIRESWAKVKQTVFMKQVSVSGITGSKVMHSFNAWILSNYSQKAW